MKRLHVLHVLNELKPSGAEVMLLSALLSFRDKGVDFTILSTGKEGNLFAGRFEAMGCEIIHLPFARTPNYFFEAWRVFRNPRWDIIHLHSDLANFYFGVVALAAGKAVLRTIHNAFEHDGTLRWRRMLQRRALKRMGVCHVAISPSVVKNEMERFGLRTEMVDNWFDDLSFLPATEAQRAAARRALDVPDSAFALVSVGNCNSVKNHGCILRALARIPASGRPLYLHAGLEDAQQSERRLALELGLRLGEEVRFLGAVADVPSLLRAADAFVMPSLYEGFGVAAMEALGSGLPSILSKVPGLRDFASQFPDIIYCDPTDESVCAAVLKVMSLSASVTEALRARQSALARQHYGIEQGVGGYVRLYRELT